jgi:hypothetical protein
MNPPAIQRWHRQGRASPRVADAGERVAGGLVELSYDSSRRGRNPKGSSSRDNLSGASFPPVLCVGGVRRQREADSENDRKPDPPHGHPGGGVWRESSRRQRSLELAALVELRLFDYLIRAPQH